MNKFKCGFTLIELLVVVTIIVVLIALLLPAMDKAIYQAELAVCAAQMRNYGVGVVNYAMNFKRSYPRREAIVNRDATYTWRPSSLKGDGRAVTNPYDDRPVLKKFVELKTLACPLTGKIDLDSSASYAINAAVYSTYNLWAGWRYWPASGGPQEGMFRMGQSFSWQNDRFRFLASTNDIFSQDPYTDGTHPDQDRVTADQVWQDQQYTGASFAATSGTSFTFSRWLTSTTNRRGPIDMHLLVDDLSVRREASLKYDDKRIVTVPLSHNTSDYATVWINLVKP